VKDTAFKTISAKMIRNTQKPEGHIINPHELTHGLIVIIEFRGMDDEAVQVMHFTSFFRSHPCRKNLIGLNDIGPTTKIHLIVNDLNRHFNPDDILNFHKIHLKSIFPFVSG
jgi:hypothetical protein